MEGLLSHKTVGVKIDLQVGAEAPGLVHNLFNEREVDYGLTAEKKILSAPIRVPEVDSIILTDSLARDSGSTYPSTAILLSGNWDMVQF